MTLQASPVAAAENTAAAPRSYPPAHIITSDDEAIGVAQNLASRFAVDAARRDQDRTLPLEELDACSQAGLWAMTVPRAYGGAQISYVTVGRVFAILAAADPSIAQSQTAK
ncbi:Acyl-CoA dehydrogenase, N-terminal domain [Burkholderia sp. GAS332]|nr:Acyl-CoA dehydrogenase, N-terminal domain [Burkholderia sp. GAS332]